MYHVNYLHAKRNQYAKFSSWVLRIVLGERYLVLFHISMSSLIS